MFRDQDRPALLPRPRRSSTSGSRLHAAGLVTTLLASFGPMLPVAAAQMSRSFEVRNVDSRVVETWVWDLCQENPHEECSVVSVSPGSPAQLTVRGSAAIIAKVVRLLAERDGYVDPTQTFQFILVEGRRGGGMDPKLPRNAVEALEDVEQVLPFDSFQLLDTGLLSTSRAGETALSGPDDARYQAQLAFKRIDTVDGPILQVTTLRVQSAPTWLEPPNGKGEGGWSRDAVIETSLSLRVGETAVVGTSKLDGGEEALILLLTALPPS